MRLIHSALLAFSISGLGLAQQPKVPNTANIDPAAQLETVIAKVERVFKIEDGGFQYISYLVTYHDKQVIVEDAICSTNHSVGDEIRFLVCRNDMSKTHRDGKKLIAFIVLPKKA